MTLPGKEAYFLAGGEDPVGRWVEVRLTDVADARS